MTTKKRMDRLVPYPVIDAAVQGDADAVSRIVDHYSGYIAAYALRTSGTSMAFPASVWTRTCGAGWKPS